MRFHEIKQVIDLTDKAMGLRLIEGMKALTDLCRNAFDNIKSINMKVGKIDGKIGEHDTRVYRLEQKGRSTPIKNKKDIPQQTEKVEPKSKAEKPAKKKE